MEEIVADYETIETTRVDINFEAKEGLVRTDDFGAIKAWALKVKAYLDTIDVTATTKKDAKAILSDARKLYTLCEDQRKAAKATINRFYSEVFEPGYRDAIEPLVECIDRLSSDIKALDEQEAEARRQEIKDTILADADNLKKGLSSFIDDGSVLWAKVCKPSFFNKSCSRIKATEEWRNAIIEIIHDLEVIEASEDKAQLMQAYRNNGNLALSMQEVADAKKALAVMAQQKAASEERERIQATTPVIDHVDIEPTVLEVTVPNENTVDPAELKTAKALRWIVGPKWKIKLLFKVGAMLGLTFANYEEKR